MSNNPINLVVRFGLELIAYISLGYWGWSQHNGLAQFVWAIGLPLGAAILWGTLRAPGHTGPTPILVPGWLRLCVEVLVFGGGVWALIACGQKSWGTAYLIVLVLHYLLSFDYVLRLLQTEK